MRAGFADFCVTWGEAHSREPAHSRTLVNRLTLALSWNSVEAQGIAMSISFAHDYATQL